MPPAKAPRPEVKKPDHTPIEEVRAKAKAVLGTDNIYLRYAVDKDRGHYTKCLLGVVFFDTKGIEKVIVKGEGDNWKDVLATAKQFGGGMDTGLRYETI